MARPNQHSSGTAKALLGVTHLIQVLDFSFISPFTATAWTWCYCSAPNFGKHSLPSPTQIARYNWAGTTCPLFQVSIDIVLRWGADPWRTDTHRIPDLAQLGIPKVVCANICTHSGIRSCLGAWECQISHHRLSGLSTPTPFLPPSAEMVGVLRWLMLPCWQTELFFLSLGYVVRSASPALINTAV